MHFLREKRKARMKLGIYFITDTSGIVDEYIYCLLEHMGQVLDRIFMLVPETITETSIERLASYRVSVLKYDIKDNASNCFLNICNIETIRKFDSITIWDDTIFGPFFPIKNIYQTMEGQNYDFWGLFKDFINRNEMDEHLFSHFFVLNRKVICSDWLVDQMTDFVFISCEFLEKLVSCLELSSFQRGIYIDLSDYADKNLSKNIKISIWDAYDLIIKRHCPFVYKEALRNTHFLPGADEIPYRTFRFIKEKTNYNINFIWQNLLRTTNMVDLKKALHLEFVLPSNCRISNRILLQNKKAAVIIHIYYKELVRECFNYIQEIPSEIDIFIFSSNRETRDAAIGIVSEKGFKNCKIYAKRNRGRDFSALLVAAKDIIKRYDYICFIHDKKSHEGRPITSGRTWMYEIWNCLLKNRDYIYNIIDTMEADRSLGLLVPPEPFHSGIIDNADRRWRKDFSWAIELTRKLGIKVCLDEKKNPVTLGTAFWCKSKALKALFNYDFVYEDFPDEPMPIDGTICHALERILGYIAQYEGYYTAYIMDSEIAGMRGTKLNTYIEGAMPILRNNFCLGLEDGGIVFDVNSSERLYKKIKELLCFFIQYPKLYIYGAGVYGRRCFEVLRELDISVQSFIVTKRTENETKIFGIPIVAAEELIESDVGIIVALKKEFRDEVIPFLKSKGYNNIMIFPY